jgi:hypothetical protein
MPNPGYDPADLAEAVRLVQLHGTVTEASNASGIPRSTLDKRYKKASTDPAMEAAQEAVGTNLVPTEWWAKTKPNEDGIAYSVRMKPAQEASIPLEERLAEAFANVARAEPITAPASVMADLCSLYPLMDVHFGMQAWGRETGGQDYDINLACQDLRHAFAKVSAITPASQSAILIVGGDFFHANDNTAETQASRHKLDVDNRHRKILEAGVDIMIECIEGLLAKHATLLVRIMRGNHDPESHLVLTFALIQRYRDEPRVTIDNSPRDLFMHQWGECAIFAHHGDKFKAQAAALYVSDVCPFWSAARHRHFFTGHVHHDHAKDIGPLRWESLRAFCPPDAYAASMGYGGRRAFQSVTFHRTDGLIVRCLDPIDRPAPTFRGAA